MSNPLEAAASEFCDMPKAIETGISCEAICVACKRRARVAILAYLRALAEQGPSNAVLDAGLECHDWTPSQIWPAMLAAHIKEVETGE
jgi:hypothetical protein